MFHYVYKVTCGQLYYFGVRTSKVEPEKDSKYIGSGIWSLYKLKFNPVQKEILGSYPTRWDAEVAETELLKVHVFKVLCQNRRVTSPRKRRTCVHV